MTYTYKLINGYFYDITNTKLIRELEGLKLTTGKVYHLEGFGMYIKCIKYSWKEKECILTQAKEREIRCYKKAKKNMI